MRCADAVLMPRGVGLLPNAVMTKGVQCARGWENPHCFHSCSMNEKKQILRTQHSKIGFSFSFFQMFFLFSRYCDVGLLSITGVHTNQDQIWLVKIGKYMGFYVDRRS